MITDKDVNEFIFKCLAITGSYCRANGYPSMILGYDDLKKNIRIWHSDLDGHSKSLHCFVDKETGDVYKGSWKAVVKNGKRGNIFDSDISRFINEYGTRYLK